MATISKSDVAVFDGLSIVRLDGYEPKPDTVEVLQPDGTWAEEPDPGFGASSIDRPGSANWLVEQYGMQGDDFDPEQAGILWTDYDGGGWEFSVLIASDEVEEFRKLATEAGYEVGGVEEIAEPIHYGDGHGVCTILRHPDGWVIVA